MVQTEPTSAERTALYRLYDSEGRLLYIGIAGNPQQRWQRHSTEHAETWWPDVDAKRVEWFDTRTGAEEAEKHAIRTEGPPYNKAHIPTSGFLEPGWRTPNEKPSSRAKAVLKERFLKGLALDKEALRRKVPMATVLAEEIAKRIGDGEYAVGERAPGVVAVANEFGVSRQTAGRALQVLVREGVLSRERGRGAIVASLPPLADDRQV